MRYFPLFADTKGMKILIVGAGDVASRKLALLKRTDAEITVIAPEISRFIETEAEKNAIVLHKRSIEVKDIKNFDLIYLAMADEATNERFAAIAKQKHIWVNVVDTPSLCDFITPSIVDRGALVVAISTAGAAPVYARELRSRLESFLPNSLSSLLDFITEKRIDVQSKFDSVRDRRLFWEKFFVANGDRFDNQTAKHYLKSFSETESETENIGELLLLNLDVDVPCLPLAVLPLFQRLDAILSDHQLPVELNELLRRDADREPLPINDDISEMLKRGERVLIFADAAQNEQLKINFPQAHYLLPSRFNLPSE